MEKVAIFIDAANISITAANLHLEIDYRRLLEHFKSQYRVLRASYYTALVTEEDGTIKHKAQIDWLSQHGYNLVTKPAKVYINDGKRRIKGNMDMEMVVDILKIISSVERIILFTGDGDFKPLIQHLQETTGVQFTVVSTTKTFPPMIGSDFKHQADEFLDLSLLRPQIGKQMHVQRVDLATRLKRGGMV